MPDDTIDPVTGLPKVPAVTPVVGGGAPAGMPAADATVAPTAPADVPAGDATAAAPLGAPAAIGEEDPKVDPGTGVPPVAQGQ